MLTRFVRNQLIIFTIASIIGVAVMLFAYMQVPTLLSVGRLTVTLEMPAAGGLYRFSNVTYRGVQIGKVTTVELTDNGAEATLSLDTSPKIPADLASQGAQRVGGRRAVRRSAAAHRLRAVPAGRLANRRGQHHDPAAGRPDAGSGEHAGGQHSRSDRISDLLDESFKAFNGAGPDFGSLIDSGAKLTERTQQRRPIRRAALIDDSGPLLDSQAETTDSIRTWARSLAGVTEQLAQNDPQIRALLRTRTRLRAGGFAAAESDQADAAGAAGEPHHAGADPGHVQPVARAAAGAASRNALSAQQAFGLAEEQPDRPGHRRLRADHR